MCTAESFMIAIYTNNNRYCTIGCSPQSGKKVICPNCGNVLCDKCIEEKENSNNGFFRCTICKKTLKKYQLT